MPLPFILSSKNPLKVFQGQTFSQPFKYGTRNAAGGIDPIDITGVTFRAQFRDGYAGSTAVLDLTTANGGFAITDAAGGEFKMDMTAVQTAGLSVPYTPQDFSTQIPVKDYNFDIEMIMPDTTVQKFLVGVLRVYGEVTR